jgi:hypothetical protein
MSLAVDSAAEELERILGTVVDDPESPQSGEALAALREFNRVDFDTPSRPESDGYLFEYGIFSSIEPAAFRISLVRQLERADESYIQVGLEISCAASSELLDLGRRKSWWFHGAALAFDSWLDEILDDRVWLEVSTAVPIRVGIAYDEV